LFQGAYTDEKLDREVSHFGRKIRNKLQSKSGFKTLHSYVNYAQGDEPVTSHYGTEAWRIEKLVKTKAEYDPENAFSFYQPIV
jgi:hypothetical protein